MAVFDSNLKCVCDPFSSDYWLQLKNSFGQHMSSFINFALESLQSTNYF